MENNKNKRMASNEASVCKKAKTVETSAAIATTSASSALPSLPSSSTSVAESPAPSERSLSIPPREQSDPVDNAAAAAAAAPNIPSFADILNDLNSPDLPNPPNQPDLPDFSDFSHLPHVPVTPYAAIVSAAVAAVAALSTTAEARALIPETILLTIDYQDFAITRNSLGEVWAMSLDFEPLGFFRFGEEAPNTESAARDVDEADD